MKMKDSEQFLCSRLTGRVFCVWLVKNNLQSVTLEERLVDLSTLYYSFRWRTDFAIIVIN